MRRQFRALLVTSLVASALAIPTGAVLAPSVAGAAVTSGFTDSLVATVSSPTSVEQLDASRVVVLEKGGQVRIVKDGALLPTPALTRSVCSSSEMGFLGFAVDPAFAVNHHVYLFWTRPKGANCVNRVSRFTMTGDTINPASEVVLLDNIAGTETESFGNHNGGDLEIPSDGYLYVSVGDSGSDPRNNSGSSGGNDAAQDRSLLNGKILRITRTGLPVPGNPFYGSAGATNCALLGPSASPSARCREIFAMGLRNPFRIAFDTNTSTTRFFINDVGQSAREEVDLGRAGANYGWPCREGTIAGTYSGSACAPSATGPLTGPLTDYGRSTGQFITGGAFVPNGAWPSRYDGAYLFADGGSGRIWLRAANGSVNYAAPFATGLTGISHLSFVLEGSGQALYYVLNGSGQVRKITSALPAPTSRGSLASQPISPIRVYDTRTGAGGAGIGPMRANTSRLVTVAGASKVAALVNITVIGSTGAGQVATWLPRTRRPSQTALTVASAGTNTSNAVIVPLDAGRTMISSTAGGHLVVDVLAVFARAAGVVGGRFESTAPSRLVDSRSAPSGSNVYTRSGTRIDVQVGGRGGVPASGLGGVALMVTALGGSSTGSVVAWAAGTSRPGVSNLSVPAGDVRSALVIARTGSGGKVSIDIGSTGAVLVDVAGWFTSTANPSGGLLTVLPPSRRVDTRTGLGFGPLGAGQSGSVTITGMPFATAIVQNVTLVGTGGSGWLTASPNTGPVPGSSTINWTGSGQTRAAATITRVPGNKSSRYTSSGGSTGVLVDVSGYFT